MPQGNYAEALLDSFLSKKPTAPQVLGVLLNKYINDNKFLGFLSHKELVIEIIKHLQNRAALKKRQPLNTKSSASKDDEAVIRNVINLINNHFKNNKTVKADFANCLKAFFAYFPQYFSMVDSTLCNFFAPADRWDQYFKYQKTKQGGTEIQHLLKTAIPDTKALVQPAAIKDEDEKKPTKTQVFANAKALIGKRLVAEMQKESAMPAKDDKNPVLYFNGYTILVSQDFKNYSFVIKKNTDKLVNTYESVNRIESISKIIESLIEICSQSASACILLVTLLDKHHHVFPEIKDKIIKALKNVFLQKTPNRLELLLARAMAYNALQYLQEKELLDEKLISSTEFHINWQYICTRLALYAVHVPLNEEETRNQKLCLEVLLGIYQNPPLPLIRHSLQYLPAPKPDHKTTVAAAKTERTFSSSSSLSATPSPPVKSQPIVDTAGIAKEPDNLLRNIEMLLPSHQIRSPISAPSAPPAEPTPLLAPSLAAAATTVIQDTKEQPQIKDTTAEIKKLLNELCQLKNMEVPERFKQILPVKHLHADFLAFLKNEIEKQRQAHAAVISNSQPLAKQDNIVASASASSAALVAHTQNGNAVIAQQTAAAAAATVQPQPASQAAAVTAGPPATAPKKRQLVLS